MGLKAMIQMKLLKNLIRTTKMHQQQKNQKKQTRKKVSKPQPQRARVTVGKPPQRARVGKPPPKKKEIVPVAAQVVLPHAVQTKDLLPGIPKKTFGDKVDTNPKPGKIQKTEKGATRIHGDKWDQLTTLPELRNEGRESDNQLKASQLKLKAAEAMIRVLRAQLAVRDKYLSVLTPQQIAGGVKEEIVETIIEQIETQKNDKEGTISYEVDKFDEEAFILLVGEAKAQQAKKITTYKLELDNPGIIELFGQGFREGLSIQIAYSRNTRYLKITGEYEPQAPVPGQTISLVQNSEGVK